MSKTGADGSGARGDIEQRVEEAFPAPSFRENQKETIVEMVRQLEEDDKDVVVLSAPTGAGKSIILYTAMAAYNGNGFITTPLNSLVDQLDNDDFIPGSVLTIKGRNNYDCIHPKDRGKPVDKAICQRDSDFECEMKDECEYYGRKKEAIERPLAVTNMSYLMAEGMIPDDVSDTFGNRDVLALDECQNLEDFGMNYISFTVSKNTVPRDVWRNIDIPDSDREDDMAWLQKWLNQEVLSACREKMVQLQSMGVLDEQALDEKEELQNFKTRVENFLDDIEDNDWVCQIERNVRKNGPNENKAVFKPIEIGRFLGDLLWSRGEKVILSSATVPSGGWLEEMGLGDHDVGTVSVPSTFPVENRPIVTGHTIGKMTADERERNVSKMAKKIKTLAEHHEGEQGFVHCRSYSMIDLIGTGFREIGEYKWFTENVMKQDRMRREESLQEWLDNDKQVFLSVAMDEGIDLKGDAARWQVLAKTLYKHMGDKRTKYRVTERNEWDWYNRHAAIQIQQAYGRGVRSEEDECVFYILDKSAIGLIRREAELFEPWFLEALHDMDIDPERGR